MKTNLAQYNLRRRRRDYITNLPEPVLSQILSCLPTKQAVQTSILSKEWVYKWTSVYKIDIRLGWIDRRSASFVNFMDRILSLSPFLTRFCLKSMSVHVLSDLHRWISIALTHRLESLEAFFRIQGVVFPCTILNSTCLRELKLHSRNSILNISAKNCASNLTRLKLCGLMILNGDPNTCTVTFNFPVLENFEANNCEWLNVKSVELYAPSLTTFLSVGPYGVKDLDYSFVIHAPRLANFSWGGSIPQIFDVIYGSSIVSARFFAFRSTVASQVGRLFNVFVNLMALEFMMAEVVPLAGTSLQPHDKLRELALMSRINAEQLLALLHASPSLKLLRMELFEWVDYDYREVRIVPSCIVSHLEEIEFLGFNCETRHYNLAKFLLENGERLKKITIICGARTREKQSEVREYISTFRVVELVFLSTVGQD